MITCLLCAKKLAENDQLCLEFQITWVLKKKKILKAFVESQFGYCPLTWTFYSRKANSKIKILEITRYTHRRSILGSLAISAGVGWAPDWFSKFSPMRTFFSSNVPSLSIFFNSFFPPFRSHSFSGWSLAILVAPCLFFIRRWINNYFLLVWEHHIASNLI